MLSTYLLAADEEVKNTYWIC